MPEVRPSLRSSRAAQEVDHHQMHLAAVFPLLSFAVYVQHSVKLLLDGPFCVFVVLALCILHPQEV